MKSKVIWSAELTADMVENLDADKVEELVEELNDLVANTCQEFGID